jgi:streptomycin 6-kinase
VAACREFGPDQPDTLLHGDLVFDNILRAEREPWLVIDPQGLRGEPAFDGAQFLGNRWSDHAACGDVGASVRRRLAAFADGAQVEYERTRRWAVARLTVDALWCREHQADAVAYVDTMIEALHIPGR